MTRLVLWAVAGVLLLSPRARAGGFARGSAGTTGADFLNLGVGARSIAMGGAYTAAADDAYALYWNPAGMLRVPDSSVGFMHGEYLDTVNMEYLAYARRLGKSMAGGGSVLYMDVGAIDETDASGEIMGSFRPRDYVATMALAARIDSLEFNGESVGLGASAKFIRSEIIEKAQTWAIDLGATVPCPSFSSERSGTCAAVAQNLGSGMKFDRSLDPLPMTFKLGWAFGLGRWTLVSADVAASRGGGIHGALGTEFTSRISDSLEGSLRLGANSLTWGEAAGFNGFYGGLGASFSSLSLDYALGLAGELGMTHRVSLTFNFGRRGDEPRAEGRNRSGLIFDTGNDSLTMWK